MSVLLETSLGDIVIDLEVKRAPKTCLNFIKLCKIKYFNFHLVHSVQKNFMCQMGDPTATGKGGESVWGCINGPSYKYFAPEFHPKLKHKRKGIVSMATAFNGDSATAASQFFITLADGPLDYLDGKQAVFGRVAEGLEVLDQINEALCDDNGMPLRDIRIKHTIILDDPFDDPKGLVVPDRSPSPSADILKSNRIAEDEELFLNIPEEELEKMNREKEAAAQALTLELVGDLPFAEIKPPENILFVCKLNPVTRDEDLDLIFSRFGKILSCEVVRDKKTGDSLCYAFIEFEQKEDAERAYLKMDNVLIDDSRIHVDFSQSVSKLHLGFLKGERRNLNESEEGGFGGQRDFKRKTRYREGSGKGADEHELLFEHNEMTLEEEKRRKRDRKMLDPPPRGDDNHRLRENRSRERERGSGGRRRSSERSRRRSRSRERY